VDPERYFRLLDRKSGMSLQELADAVKRLDSRLTWAVER
jgi:hypothetical protein